MKAERKDVVAAQILLEVVQKTSEDLVALKQRVKHDAIVTPQQASIAQIENPIKQLESVLQMIATSAEFFNKFDIRREAQNLTEINEPLEELNIGFSDINNAASKPELLQI